MPRPSPVFTRLRRALVAKGLTTKPTCGQCRRECEPRAIKMGLCAECFATFDASEGARLHDRIDDLEHRLDLLAKAEPGTPEQEAARDALRLRIESQLFDTHAQLEPEERAAAFGEVAQ